MENESSYLKTGDLYPKEGFITPIWEKGNGATTLYVTKWPCVCGQEGVGQTQSNGGKQWAIGVGDTDKGETASVGGKEKESNPNPQRGGTGRR